MPARFVAGFTGGLGRALSEPFHATWTVPVRPMAS
jgi:hypothetical protein